MKHKSNNLTSYHKRLLTEIPIDHDKTTNIQPNISFYSPLNTNNNIIIPNDLPHIQKSLTKFLNPSLTNSRNFKLISSKHSSLILLLEISDKNPIIKTKLNTQRPNSKILTQSTTTQPQPLHQHPLPYDSKASLSSSKNRLKNSFLPRKSYDEYYDKISNHSSYTSFAKISTINKLKLLAKDNNEDMRLTTTVNEDKENNHTLSISKTVTKTTTMSPIKYLTEIETVKTHEELHHFIVDIIQKGRRLEGNFDLDDNINVQEDYCDDYIEDC